MRIKILLCIFVAVIAFGCASRKDRLQAEYDRISKAESALKEERKKIVNLENAIQDAVKARQSLEKRYKEMASIRDENYQQSQPLGPKPPSIDSPYAEQLQEIKKNYESITKQIDALFEERKNIVEEQYN